MQVIYERVIEVNHLEKPYAGARMERHNGYAVHVDEHWFWFPALEPAYAFGRAGRMSNQFASFGVGQAATKQRWDETLRRDVFTLHVLKGSQVPRDSATDRRLLTGFLAGVDTRSPHWRRHSS